MNLTIPCEKSHFFCFFCVFFYLNFWKNWRGAQLGSDHDNAGSGFNLKDLHQAFSIELVLENNLNTQGGPV